MVEPGQKISHYKILGLLGEGGMGRVYLAHDTILGRKVAVKVLSKNMEAKSSAHERFVREARVAAGLDHPFVCKVYEAGEEGDDSYIVMEYVEGETLADRIRRGPLSMDEASKIATEVSEALQVAHEHGIVHRDLKPANIMLAQDHAKVMDFGLAKQLDWGGSVDPEATTAIDQHLTQTGVAIGTLAYMSPEQAKGKKVDVRSDIFSLGVIFQEMLTGEHPFKRGNALETMRAILLDPPSAARPEGSRPPSEVSAILRKTMAKKPEERYPNGKDLAEELRKLRRNVVGGRR